MPNHCSQSNVFHYYTFVVLLSLQCPSGCYRRFVILLAVPPHSLRQLLCPSCHFVHFFLRFASLHLVRIYPFASRLSIPKPVARHSQGMHQPFASHPYNTHWVPIRFTTSFIHFSSVQSTRCLLFGSPAAHFGCVHLADANCSFVPHLAKHR